MALLATDLLVMKQVTQFMSNDFDVLDANGQVVGLGHTGGSMLSRLFLGPRRITVSEIDGTAVLTVIDPPQFLGRDRMEIVDADGLPVAELVKQLALVRTSLTVNLYSAGELNVEGSWLGTEFQVTRNGAPVARITRKLASLEQFLGYGRYAIEFAPGQQEDIRRAVIGSAIALDLIRRKARQRSS